MSGAKWIDRHLVISPYHIGLCTTEKQFQYELRNLKVQEKNWPDWMSENADATVHEFQNEKNGAICCIVCIEKNADYNPLEVIGLLSHEAVHIWQKIKRNFGEEEPSDEFEAYSIQSIAQRLIKAYGNHPKKGRLT